MKKSKKVIHSFTTLTKKRRMSSSGSSQGKKRARSNSVAEVVKRVMSGIGRGNHVRKAPTKPRKAYTFATMDGSYLTAGALTKGGRSLGKGKRGTKPRYKDLERAVAQEMFARHYQNRYRAAAADLAGRSYVTNRQNYALRPGQYDFPGLDDGQAQFKGAANAGARKAFLASLGIRPSPRKPRSRKNALDVTIDADDDMIQ